MLNLARAVRELIRRLHYVRARFAPPLGCRPPHDLALCAIFRDEGRYLAEWVTFHRLQGVERFYLYNNRSSDNWRTELEPEIQAGIVEVSDWPREPGQLSAYDDCVTRHRDDARWIAFIDVDEFLFSPTGEPLPAVLRRFDTKPGVAVNRLFYGTNGYQSPPEGLVTENYLMRAREDNPSNVLVKMIVYPRRAIRAVSAHYFELKGNPVDEDGLPALHLSREPVTVRLLRINHYYAKSEQQFRHKSTHPRPDIGAVTERMGIPPAEIRDEVIRNVAPDLREAMSARRLGRTSVDA